MSNEECGVTVLINELENITSSEPTIQSLSDAINKLEEYIIQSRKENSEGDINDKSVSVVKDELEVWKRIIRAKELLEQLEHSNEVLTNMCVAMQSVALRSHDVNHTVDNNNNNKNSESNSENAWTYFHAIHVANSFICKERLACNPLKARQVVTFTTNVLNKLQEAIVSYWMTLQAEQKHKTHYKTHQVNNNTHYNNIKKINNISSTIEKTISMNNVEAGLSLECILSDMNVNVKFASRDLCLDHVTSTIWRYEAKELYMALCHEFNRIVELRNLLSSKWSFDKPSDVMMTTMKENAANNCNEANSATENSTSNSEKSLTNKFVNCNNNNNRAKSESKSRDEGDECKVQHPAMFLHPKTVLEEENKNNKANANYSETKVNHLEGGSESMESDNNSNALKRELEEKNKEDNERANRTNQSHRTHSFHKTHFHSKHKSHSVSSDTSRHHTQDKTLRTSPPAHSLLMECVEPDKLNYIPPIINKAARLRALTSRRKTGIDDPRLCKLTSRRWRSNHRTRSSNSRNESNNIDYNNKENDASIDSKLYNRLSTNSYHTENDDITNDNNFNETERDKSSVSVNYDIIDSIDNLVHYSVKLDNANKEEVEEEMSINKYTYKVNTVIDESNDNLQLPPYNESYVKEYSKDEIDFQANMKRNGISLLDPHALTQASTFTESGYITPTISPPSTMANFSSMEIKINNPLTTYNEINTGDTATNELLATEHKFNENAFHESNDKKTGVLPSAEGKHEQEKQTLQAEAEYEWKEIVGMANHELVTLQTNKTTANAADSKDVAAERNEIKKPAIAIHHERIYSGVSASTESDMPDFAMPNTNELHNKNKQDEEEQQENVEESEEDYKLHDGSPTMETVSEVESIEYEDEINDKYSHTIYRDEANINDEDNEDEDGIWLPRRWSDPGEFELAEVHTMRSEMSYEPSLRSTRYYNMDDSKRRSPETETNKTNEYGTIINNKIENEKWQLHHDVMMNENVECNVVLNESTKGKTIRSANNEIARSNCNSTNTTNNITYCNNVINKRSETVKGAEGINSLTEMLNELDQANQMALRHALEKRPHRRRAVH